MEFKHISVLYNESLDALNIKPDGLYVDCTAGGGGHSFEILRRLGEKGRLICIDRDPDAIERLTERFSGDERVTIVRSNFSEIEAILDNLGTEKVDGIMADLGISSHQVDEISRGFSVHGDGPLDMRMSREGVSAYDIVNSSGEKELVRILRQNGEEPFAPSIARNIVKAREKKPIETTTELAEIIKYSIPAKRRRTGGHPAIRSFQAIRIEVNGELEVLKNTLNAMFTRLKPGGRLSIITFHSLEDRIVKRKFIEYCTGCICPKTSPICTCGRTPAAKMPFKFIKPGEEEIIGNPRSRSATLRCVEKIHELYEENSNGIH